MSAERQQARLDRPETEQLPHAQRQSVGRWTRPKIRALEAHRCSFAKKAAAFSGRILLLQLTDTPFHLGHPGAVDRLTRFVSLRPAVPVTTSLVSSSRTVPFWTLAILLGGVSGDLGAPHRVGERTASAILVVGRPQAALGCRGASPSATTRSMCDLRPTCPPGRPALPSHRVRGVRLVLPKLLAGVCDVRGMSGVPRRRLRPSCLAEAGSRYRSSRGHRRPASCSDPCTAGSAGATREGAQPFGGANGDEPLLGIPAQSAAPVSRSCQRAAACRRTACDVSAAQIRAWTIRAGDLRPRLRPSARGAVR